MDQPNRNQDNESQNTGQGADAPQSTTDGATPINVTVQSDDDNSAVDSVLDGVPSSSDPVADMGMPTEPASVSAAEEIVAEALPQSTSDELAAVASELESMASSGVAVDEPQPQVEQSSSDGVDPMQQIMQDAQAPVASEPYVEPAQEVSTESTGDQAESPADTQPHELSPEVMSSEPDAGSMETVNEYGEPSDTPAQPEMPAEEQSSSQDIVATEPESQPLSESPTEEENSSQPDMTSEYEQAMSESAVVEEQVAEPVEAEQAPVNETPVAMAVTEEPSSSASNDSSEPTEESPAHAPSTNEVVTPSVVAAALAAGTAGDNAITGTPETNDTDKAQDAPKQTATVAPKSSNVMIIVVVAIVTLLFGGGAVAAYMMQPEKTKETATVQTEEPAEEQTGGTEEADTPTAVEATPTDTAAPGEKVEAKALDDYKAACSTGGIVTNASSYTGVAPHPIVVFEKGSDDKYAQSLVSFKDATWSASASKVTGGQLVACIARKTASEVKLKDCPITDSVTKVTADVALYSTKYTVDVYEALTGKKVTSFENSSISTTCPTNAVYNKADPKIYAVFDQVALETSLKDVVTKAL